MVILDIVAPDDVFEYIQGALVSLDPTDGAIVALSGGYDFVSAVNEFNRATQAKRQPGSSFKPFFYLSVLDRGYTLASIVSDVCESYFDETLEREHCVQNYERRYHGELPLRDALYNSLNAAADRIIRSIGASYVGNYVERFGFNPGRGERNASLALGSLAVTPLELAAAYSVIANGGHAVGIRAASGGPPRPYFVQRVESASGEVLYDASLSVERVCSEPVPDPRLELAFPLEPAPVAGASLREELIEEPGDLFPWPLRCAEQVESPQRIYLITDVMKQVVRSGSGVRAGREFQGRDDLFGKTGTTNDTRDAWFAGGNAGLVTVAWVGFDDDTRELGTGEQGGRTAIPAWIDFMRVALAGIPEREQPRPPGIVDLRIVKETGLVAADCRRDFDWEIFVEENQPAREPDTVCFGANSTPLSTEPGSSPGSAPGSSSGRLFE